MSRFFGIFGIIFIFLIAFLMSNNKRSINFKTIGMGFLLQILLAVFVLKTAVGQFVFGGIGMFIQKILDFANIGASFMFGPLNNAAKLNELFGAGSIVFAIQLMCTIILIAVIVNILYYYRIMQRIVAVLGKAMYKLMDVSGAEALSNVASSFVGQINPYLGSI